MTSTSIPLAQPAKYHYSRDLLLKIKTETKPDIIKDIERTVIQRLKHFRLDKNSVLQRPAIKVQNKNTENQQPKKGEVLSVPQSAGPKLGRTTDGKSNKSLAIDKQSMKENYSVQKITNTTARLNVRPLVEQNIVSITPPKNLIVKPLGVVTPTFKPKEIIIMKTPPPPPLPSLPSPPVVVPTVIVCPDITMASPIFQTPIKSLTPTCSPLSSSPSSASKCETDPHRLKQRQKQIDYGYRTIGYIRYKLKIPPDTRLKEHPKTPRKSQACSKRSWDGQVKKWRRELHKWDPEDPKEYEYLMTDQILLSVYGDTPDMPLIVTQLQEQIAEFMKTGKFGKISDASLDETDNDTDTRDTELTTPQNHSSFRSIHDFEKPSTVRMLVF
jgi:hypothetical protein